MSELTITVPQIQDIELQAIAICQQALSKLEPKARIRVTRYLVEKQNEDTPHE